MLKDKESYSAEELSQCLDSLNDGKDLIAADEEIKELVALAALVKESARQEELPRVLIDQVVDNLATEFQAKKQKQPNHWLYRSLVGAAAAVVIAGFVQFLLPQSANHNITQQIDENIDAQKMTAAADQSSQAIITESTNTITPPQVQPSHSTKEYVVIPTAEKPVAAVSKVLAEIVKAAEPPSIDQKNNQVAMLQQEKTKDTTIQKSVSMRKTSMNPLREDENIQPDEKTTRVMVMPNRTTQSITVDSTNGEVKQVYNLGDNDEVVITQRLSDASQATSRALQPLATEAQDRVNSLTVRVDKYSIKIEGKKTSEELEKIAESLIEKEMEQ